ncbi:MAG: T9SS type A sorting domain-containing protein [Bacteroidetes bacterium]|nr:T9SS type A sorting domain-containing protein [Bacteroidota bacterium]
MTLQADAPWFVILDKNGNLKNKYRISPAASWPYALTFLPFGLYSVHFYGVQGGVWGSVGTHGSLILESDTAVFANWTNLFDAWGSGIGGCFYDSKTDNNYLGTTLFIQDTNSICSEVSRGGFDGVVYKTDWLGNVLWTKLYGNNCRDNLAGVFDYNDTLLLAYGYTQSAAGNEISHTIHDYNANCAASGADLWLLLINKNNPFQYCDTIFGGNRLDICGFNSLSRYDDTTFYWVSSSSSDSSFEKTSHKNDTASTSKELWLLKMIISPYALSGLGWQTAEATAPPTVFPNPTNNMLHVSFDTKGPYKLTIQNMQGAIVYSGIFSPGACSVYIGHLAPATYTYTVSTLEGTSFYGKVIKY